MQIGKDSLENRELAAFLLPVPLIMQTEDGFVHNARHQEHLLDFFFLGNTAEFIMKSDRDLGFEELLLLLVVAIQKKCVKTH